MDRLNFLITEHCEYLKHSVFPYCQHVRGLAGDAVRVAADHSRRLYSELSQTQGVPLANWIRWHWSWFLQHCNYAKNEIGRSLAEISVMVQRQGSGSHVVILLAGVAVGFFIGVRVGAGGGPQQRMRALVCNSYAGAESVAVTEDLFAANASSCGPDEVLVEVKASSIDPMDIRITLGYGKGIRRQYHRYNKGSGKYLFPFPLGRECSGRVLEIGSKVQDIDIGDEVYAAVPYYACGVCAEVALIPAGWVARKPAKLSHEAAAALPYSASLAWNAVVRQARLDRHTTRGKRVLIHAVQNPVGCIAVQLIKAWGGHVTATVTKRGLAVAKALGVDEAVVYDAKGAVGAFERLKTSAVRFDAVLNTVGSFLHESCVELCADDGVVVSTVLAPPASDQYGVLLGSLFSWWLRLKLFFYRGGVCGEAPISRPVLDEISSLVDSGLIQPVVDRVLDISQGEQAALIAAKGDAMGKIVIRFRNRPLNRTDGFA